jgi:hypothetical protein
VRNIHYTYTLSIPAYTHIMCREGERKIKKGRGRGGGGDENVQTCTPPFPNISGPLKVPNIGCRGGGRPGGGRGGGEGRPGGGGEAGRLGGEGGGAYVCGERVRCQKSEFRDQESGVRSPGVRSLESGVRSQESGVRS